MSSVIITILLLFGIYNSTMLWEINNRKTALAAANEDLQRKTEELNRSNQSLQQSNDDLAKKTKEAQENLAEANKQKRAAEDNLTEADKQRKIAEQNLAEANKQKKIAEDNLAEANRQQAAAKANAQEANLQRGIAEENMRTAQKNEAAANEANTNLKIKTSEVLANQAQTYYEKDDIFKAIQTAADALELCGEEETNIAAENVLIRATGVYSTGSKMLCNKINLPGLVKFLEFGEDGAHILAKKMEQGKFDLEDFLNTTKQIKKLGPLENLLKLLPGASKMGLNNVDIDPKIMARTEAIVLSMTVEERRNPDIIKASRKVRIAKGCGQKVDGKVAVKKDALIETGELGIKLMQRLYRFSARWQFINHAHVQIAINSHGEVYNNAWNIRQLRRFYP